MCVRVDMCGVCESIYEVCGCVCESIYECVCVRVVWCV